MNIFLSLLIFNPLEAIVLFWAAIGDKSKVFRKENIKHFYILGTINFYLQYFVENLPPSIINLFLTYFYSILIPAFILKIYFLKIMKINIKFLRCFFAMIFTAITILFGIIVVNNFFFNAGIEVTNIYIEIIVNLFIKFIQLLLLFIFGGFHEKKY